MLLTDRIRRNWCLREGQLAEAVTEAAAADGPLPPVVVVDDFRAVLLGDLDPPERDALALRLSGLVALANLVRTRNLSHLPSAADAFNGELRDVTPGAAAPAAAAVAAVLNRCPFRPDQAGPLFAAPEWSPGLYMVFDWLRDRYGPARRIIAETTPILTTSHSEETILNLVVERHDEGSGLITPDVWAMGLIAFGRDPGKSKPCLVAIQDALRVGGGGHRLRWRLKFRYGSLVPTDLQGRSAEVAAACCARAVAERTSADEVALLDEAVAVTGTLEQDQRIGPVHETGFIKKLVLAHRSRALTTVLHSPRQRGRTSPCPALQPVETLDDAFRGLLVTDGVVARVKREISRAYAEAYEERPTNPVLRLGQGAVGPLGWGC